MSDDRKALVERLREAMNWGTMVKALNICNAPTLLLEAANAIEQPAAAAQVDAEPDTSDWRMNAYYFGFARTGVAAIDCILSAVACAGKAYHNTECWSDECAPYGPQHRGNDCVEWIQNAANDAAEAFRRLRAVPPSAQGVPRDPTEDMQAAGLTVDWERLADDIVPDVWRAMYDAALAAQGEQAGGEQG